MIATLIIFACVRATTKAIDLKDNELPETLQNDISMLLFTNARYGSAGVKANVSIKANGNSIEIIDNNEDDDGNDNIHDSSNTSSNNMVSVASALGVTSSIFVSSQKYKMLKN